MGQTITYQWLVEGMDCFPSSAGQIDVAKTVRWRCNATDGMNTATTYGSVDLDPYVAGSPFTAFSSLTQSDVLGWVKAKLNATISTVTADIEAKLAAEITTPAVITLRLPWVK